MNKYEYIVCSDSETYPENARPFECVWDSKEDVEEIAEEAAKHDHQMCDGWERGTDNLTVEIFKDGTSWGKVLVERDYDVTFYGTQVP